MSVAHTPLWVSPDVLNLVHGAADRQSTQRKYFKLDYSYVFRVGKFSMNYTLFYLTKKKKEPTSIPRVLTQVSNLRLKDKLKENLRIRFCFL